MAAPQNTRSALSEIPGRLEQLRVAATPTNQMADEPTPANVLNPLILDETMTNISLQQSSPTIASPDEFVIRQRGRRRFTLTWSPDKLSAQSPFQKTPTKGASHMTLRSSPCKRLHMTETSFPKSPAKCAANHIQKSSTTYGSKSLCNTTPVKKLKLDEKSIATSNVHINLRVLLRGLSHSQLIEIIGNLVEKDGSLEEKIRADFPVPDIR